MIQVLNGGLITTDATEKTIVPMEYNTDGTLVPAGRNTFCFEIVTGSVQTSVGAEIDVDAYVHATETTAGTKWLLTATPQLQEGGYKNIRGKGVATFKIFW